MKFHIHTYGCQMNVRDSEALAALLRQRGHEPASGEASADLVIVNTCSVRGKAEDKAIGKLGLLVATKREHPRRIVGVVGCMAQRLGPDLLARIPGLDFALGTYRLARLPAALDLIRDGYGPHVDTAEEDVDLEQLHGHADGVVSAFVNILLGCDRFCAYCVVPHVRGRERSRTAEDVLAEIGALAKRGVREVTLLGQSVMSYGRRPPVWPESHVSALGLTEPLPRLLEAASHIAGIERIRFTSGHPSGCTPELARAMAELPPVCEHLHLPLQSGSDRVLERMRRGYTSDDYRRAVDRIRRAVPRLALTTDIIVGFPGESADDFEATRRFCKEMAFDNAFIFKYSPRPNTPASGWRDDVPAEEKVRRNRLLLEEQDVCSLTLHDRLVGTVQEVLSEGISLRNARRWAGRTRSNKIVIFEPTDGLRPGVLVNVQIDRVMAQTLYGDVVA
jgi:tRNA-2-methylthio-N6-dimethylallyladenosine synthase